MNKLAYLNEPSHNREEYWIVHLNANAIHVSFPPPRSSPSILLTLSLQSSNACLFIYNNEIGGKQNFFKNFKIFGTKIPEVISNLFMPIVHSILYAALLYIVSSTVKIKPIHSMYMFAIVLIQRQN